MSVYNFSNLFYFIFKVICFYMGPYALLHQVLQFILMAFILEKSQTHRDAETLLNTNSRLYCKKFKNPRLKETHKNETTRLITNAVPRVPD